MTILVRDRARRAVGGGYSRKREAVPAPSKRRRIEVVSNGLRQ
jgi:hypothetical protein